MQDVSLENMLVYVRDDGQRRVSVCDPGQAVLFTVDPLSGAEKPVPFNGFVAKEFRPPELYSSPEYYATKVDAWCLGYSTFYLLVGDRLFQTADPAVRDPDWILFSNGELSKLFEQKGANSILSHQAKDFITRLLEPDPQHRMTVKSAFWHPWLVERNQSAAQVKLSSSLATSRPPSPAKSSGADLSTVPGQSFSTCSGDMDSQIDPSETVEQDQQEEPCATVAETKLHSFQDRKSRLVVPGLQLSNDHPTLLNRLQEKQMQNWMTSTKGLQSSPR